MKRTSGTAAALLVALLAAGPLAQGAEAPTREEYVAAVEPICQRDREAGERILGGTRENIRQGKLRLAGGQMIRASKRFGKTIGELVAVPRPPDDEAKLQKWFGFLRIVRTRLRKTGVFYRQGKELQATHESIRAEKSGNAANNVSFAFGFRYCRLDRARFN